MLAQTYQPTKQLKQNHAGLRMLETGFLSPAANHLEERLNLHDYLVQYPTSTFFVKVEGDDDNTLGLRHGDLLIIDRSIAPKSESLVVADIDGEHRICRLIKHKTQWLLEKGDGTHLPVRFDEYAQSPVWGKVTHVIHATP